MFWVISVYFNIRNTLPKSGTFLLGHPVYIYIYKYIYVCVYCVCVQYYIFGANDTFLAPLVYCLLPQIQCQRYFCTAAKLLFKFYKLLSQQILHISLKPIITHKFRISECYYYPCHFIKSRVHRVSNTDCRDLRSEP